MDTLTDTIITDTSQAKAILNNVKATYAQEIENHIEQSEGIHNITSNESSSEDTDNNADIHDFIEFSNKQDEKTFWKNKQVMYSDTISQTWENYKNNAEGDVQIMQTSNNQQDKEFAKEVQETYNTQNMFLQPNNQTAINTWNTDNDKQLINLIHNHNQITINYNVNVSAEKAPLCYNTDLVPINIDINMLIQKFKNYKFACYENKSGKMYLTIKKQIKDTHQYKDIIYIRFGTNHTSTVTSCIESINQVVKELTINDNNIKSLLEEIKVWIVDNYLSSSFASSSSKINNTSSK